MSRLEPLSDYRLDEPDPLTPDEQFAACNDRERYAYGLDKQFPPPEECPKKKGE